jgi:dihydrofolate synthase/folylpolyglutamate synthase
MFKYKSYDAQLRELYGYKRLGIRPSLPPVRNLLGALGNPHRKMNTVHIAGTNGKGSTTAFTASILKEARYKTGAFFSPHVLDYRERIQINGKMIPKKEVVEALRLMGEIYSRAKKSNGRLPKTVTFFEWTTALAFFCFARAGVDVAVMETGMGGRFDATNVVDPVVSVITTISIDHATFLGKKLSDIAFEKSGIIKKGRPVVCGAVPKGAADVIRETARKRRSKLFLYGKNFSVNRDGELLSDLTPPIKIGPAMAGDHQIHNASLAAEALLASGSFEISPAQFSRGIKKTKLPGRFQVEKMKGGNVIYDVAHNPAAIKTLVGLLKEKYPKRKFNIIFGALRGKNVLAMLKELAPVTKKMACVTTDDFRAIDTGTLCRTAKKAGINAKPVGGDSLAEFMRASIGAAPLIVTGSFTTVEVVIKSVRP